MTEQIDIYYGHYPGPRPDDDYYCPECGDELDDDGRCERCVQEQEQAAYWRGLSDSERWDVIRRAGR